MPHRVHFWQYAFYAMKYANDDSGSL